VKEGFKRGNQGGGVKGPRWHLEVRSLAARGGRKRREEAAALPAQAARTGRE
jgi:hypothetical protein